VESALVLWVAAAVLLAVGFAGLLLPAIPGAAFIFLGLVAAAWAEGFAHVGFWTLAVLALMTLLTWGVDFAATAFGARRFGATPKAAAGAAIGTLVGLFFGLAGILLGPFLGAIAGELLARRSMEEAGRAGLGATLGLAIGAAVKVALAFAMVGIFLVARFSGD
jgi:uncharacterized protein YqgC (DUF456 family)